MWLIWVLIICLVIYALWQILFAVKLPLQTLNFYSGGLGSGKTLKLVDTALKLRRKSILMYKLTRIIPIKKVQDKFKIREIYSNFPIRIDKKKNLWSTPLEKAHIMGQIRMSERCIICIDEASQMFPNQNKKSDDNLIFNIRFIRHFVNCTLLMADQDVGEIDIAVRRRINKVYMFFNFKKIIPFIMYRINVMNITFSESLEIQNNTDVNEFGCRYIVGFFGKKHYDSRYMRKYYQPKDEEYNKQWCELTIDPNGSSIKDVEKKKKKMSKLKAYFEKDKKEFEEKSKMYKINPLESEMIEDEKNI